VLLWFVVGCWSSFLQELTVSSVSFLALQTNTSSEKAPKINLFDVANNGKQHRHVNTKNFERDTQGLDIVIYIRVTIVV
jgi:hypothetical protein